MTRLRPVPVANPDDEEFWAYTARGELRLQRCSQCGRLRYPPAPCCPDCLSTTSTWVPVSGRGHLLSWARFHRSYFPGLPVPYLVVVVELAEGPLMVGNLVSAAGAGDADDADPVDGPGELRAGRPVRVAFQRVDLEDGGALTLPQWQFID
jgi:Predicted nucleic-acid-binding protein containing a Zn-ribbon